MDVQGFRPPLSTVVACLCQIIKSGPEKMLGASSFSIINMILSVLHFIIDGGPFSAGASTKGKIYWCRHSRSRTLVDRKGPRLSRSCLEIQSDVEIVTKESKSE